MSVRTWLNESCGIPESDMVGMRNPFLITNPGIRKVSWRCGQSSFQTSLSSTALMPPQLSPPEWAAAGFLRGSPVIAAVLRERAVVTAAFV